MAASPVKKVEHIVNLTPNIVRLVSKDGEETEIHPCNLRDRVKIGSSWSLDGSEIEAPDIRVPVEREKWYGVVYGLPPPNDFTIYIVSERMATQAPDRDDLYVLGEMGADFKYRTLAQLAKLSD